MAQSEGNDAFALGLECGHPILALEKGETKPGSAGQGRQLEVQVGRRLVHLGGELLDEVGEVTRRHVVEPCGADDRRVGGHGTATAATATTATTGATAEDRAAAPAAKKRFRWRSKDYTPEELADIVKTGLTSRGELVKAANIQPE